MLADVISTLSANTTIQNDSKLFINTKAQLTRHYEIQFKSDTIVEPLSIKPLPLSTETLNNKSP